MSGKTEHKMEPELKVEDKHSLVFFICAWLGVGCNILNILNLLHLCLAGSRLQYY